MAGKISELPTAGSLVGSELLETVQSGANHKTTVDDVATYVDSALSVTTHQLTTDNAVAALQTDLDTKVTAVVGKQLSTEDYSTAEKTKVAAQTPTTGNRVVALGTSLMQHNNTANSTKKVSTWSKGPISVMQAMFPGLITFENWYDDVVHPNWEPSGAGTTVYFRGSNCGIGGSLLSQIHARKEFVLTKMRPDIVIINCAGTNDFSTQTKEYIHAQRIALVEYFVSNGVKVLFGTIPMRTDVSWSLASNYRDRCRWVNEQTRDYAAGRNNVYFFDQNEINTDFTSTIGNPLNSPDGTHDSTLSAFRKAKQFGAIFQKIIAAPVTRVLYPGDVYNAVENPLGNKMANPLQTGTGGTISAPVTGTAPNSMRVTKSSATNYGTCVASVEARSGRSDSYAVLTVTPAAGADQTTTDVWYYQTSTSALAHGLAVGTWVRACIEVTLSNWDGWKGASMYLKETNGINAIGLEDYDDAWPSTYDGPLTIWSPPMQIVEAGSSLTWRVMIKNRSYMSSPTAGVAKLALPQLRVVADPRTLVGYLGE